MRLRPNLLLLPLALLAAGLVTLVVVQTIGALEQVDRAQQEKGETLQRTVISAMRGVVRYGRDKEERIEAVLEEIAKDPMVLSVAMVDSTGSPVIAKGAPLGRAGGQEPATGRAGGSDLLRLVEPFELGWQRGPMGPPCSAAEGGCGDSSGGGRGRGGAGQLGRVSPGSYRLILVLDQGPAAQVSRLILVQAVALSAIILLAAAVGGLLMRSIRQRGRLSRRVAVEQHKRESLESLRLLAAGLAHEIRNPLGAIRGYAQLLHEQSADQDAKAKTGVMLSELDRVGERLEEFLAFARERQVKLEPLDLSALADEIMTLLQPDAEAAGIALSRDQGERPVRCHGDARQLKELVLNLVLNAIEACSEGDRVTIAVATESDPIVLTVLDSGKGIELDDLPRIFEPYFTTRDNGSGLGLAISKRIAESHRGSLEVDSTPGTGTTVRLMLPVSG